MSSRNIVRSSVLLAAVALTATLTGCSTSHQPQAFGTYSAPAPSQPVRLNLSMASGDRVGVAAIARQTAPTPNAPAYASVPIIAE